MANWTLAKSLVTLRQQVDGLHPRRSKRSDGTVGDAAHQARKSDHNRNERGYVTALDLTHDPQGGFDSYKFAEHLRVMKDPRVKYIISNRKIAHAPSFRWQSYHGKNPHSAHVHVSVNRSGETNAGLWAMPVVRAAAHGVMGQVDPPGDGFTDQQREALPPGDPNDRCWYEDITDIGKEEDKGEVPDDEVDPLT